MKAKKHDWLFRRMQDVASELEKATKGDPAGGLAVAGAQAQALAKTLREYTLRGVKPNLRAMYLNSLFSVLMEDLLNGSTDISGRVVFIQNPKRKR